MQILIFLIFVAVFSQVQKSPKNPFKIKLIKYKTHQNSLKPKHESISFLSYSPKINIDHYENSEYVGEIGIGNPPQFMNVIFDTGSGNFFINSNRCQASSCKSRPSFDRAKSTSYIEKGDLLYIEFAKGHVSGIMCQDTLDIGGLKISSQDFAEVTEEDEETFFNKKYSGIMGLGFSPLASKGTTPVLDRISSSGQLERSIFSFFFTLDPDEESELMIGNTDETKYYGEIHWIPLTENPFYWSVYVDDIKLGENSLGICNKCIVSLDTGTTSLSMPSQHYEKIISLFDNDCESLYQYPDLVYVIDGKDYRIPADVYVIKETDPTLEASENCHIAVSPIDIPPPLGPVWLLGDLFLSQYYSIFNKDSMTIGLAKAKHKKDKSS